MGSETTTTFLRFLLLYMINFPAAQARLQAELDRVAGRDRAPALADARAGALPYTEAVIAEIQGRGAHFIDDVRKSLEPFTSQTLYKFCLSAKSGYFFCGPLPISMRPSFMNGPQRHATIVPFGVNHAPMADTTFAGYDFLRRVGHHL